MEEERNAVFGTFYVPDNKPWLNYHEATDDYRNSVVPIALMMLRWDGKGTMGFIGGFVDKGETIEQALYRELKEEIHFNSERFASRKFEFICSHTISEIKLKTHLFALPVSYEEFCSIEKDAQSSEHFGSEVFGILRAPFYSDIKNTNEKRRKNGLVNFLGNKFAPTVLEEILVFVLKKKFLNEEELKEVCKMAGINFNVLTST